LAGAISQNVLYFSEPGNVTTTSNSWWWAWAQGKVDELPVTGSAVLVDFTDAWCVTCQYNKKNTLANAELWDDLKVNKVVLLCAD